MWRRIIDPILYKCTECKENIYMDIIYTFYKNI